MGLGAGRSSAADAAADAITARTSSSVRLGNRESVLNRVQLRSQFGFAIAVDDADACRNHRHESRVEQPASAPKATLPQNAFLTQPWRCRGTHVSASDSKGARLRKADGGLAAVMHDASGRQTRGRLAHCLLVDAEGRPDRPETHPQPTHRAHLRLDCLEPKGVLREDSEVQVQPGNGSNWLQSPRP